MLYFPAVALVSTSKLSKSFGAVDVFSDISISIPHRARIAIVGANGIGKSTFLRIIAGRDEPSDGTVSCAKNLRIGFLPQEADYASTQSLWVECLSSFSDIQSMEQLMAQLEHQMASEMNSDAIMKKYASLRDRYEAANGYQVETQIKQTLTGLGFTPDEFYAPIEQLSGGQKTRAYLAKLLLSKPNLLLLDEPTNHLDIQAVGWLEDRLKEQEGAVVVISHDRYFIDQIAMTVWEMSPSIEIFNGNYTTYLRQRAERYERRLREYLEQQEFIEKENDFIQRNIAGQNTRQAQGRRKRLERMLDEARLTPPTQTRPMTLKLKPSNRSGELVLSTKELQIGYKTSERALFSSPDLVLRRTECAALIGPNGTGKTTFLKTLLGNLVPYAGSYQMGANVKIGYFAQAHEDLNPKKTPLEEIESVQPMLLPEEIRKYLAKYLFTGDEVFKKVSTLSGGERSRLVLAKLGLMGANFLVLDEPTNHLDLESQDILQSVLKEFEETILLVSHDRYLIDALATQIWMINPEELSLVIFKGNYSEYRSSLTIDKEVHTTRDRKIPTVHKTNNIHKKTNRVALLKIENEISELEKELRAVTAQLEMTGLEPGVVARLGETYNDITEALDTLLSQWASLSIEQPESRS
jgi:ATP-binding cassette subfamily F protein 3